MKLLKDNNFLLGTRFLYRDPKHRPLGRLHLLSACNSNLLGSQHLVRLGLLLCKLYRECKESQLEWLQDSSVLSSRVCNLLGQFELLFPLGNSNQRGS